jgi:hypothetical protein
MLDKNVHHNQYLQIDWNTFGKSVFEFSVLENCGSTEELDLLEKQLIKEYKLANNCYNISEGGQVSRVVYYKKWEGLKSPDGQIYTDIQNMEEFSRKHKLCPDKLRQVSVGKRYSYKGWITLVREKLCEHRSYWKGKRMSSESNNKRSISLKLAYVEGKKVPNKKTKIYSGIVSPSGVVYNNVNGLSEFCRLHNLPSKGMMSELCSEKIKEYKGWTYNPSIIMEN